MSSATASSSTAAPAASSSSKSTTTHINNSYLNNWSLPSGIQLPQFDGTNWSQFSGVLEAVLTLMEGEDLINLTAAPSGTDVADWESLQRRSCAYLRLYVKQDIFSLVASNTEFPHFKSKWDKLKELYGGATGSTTIFNLWINLTQACLDDSSPMAPQLAKLNESRVALANASMGVTDTQYCLILLNALPSSYEVLASTILAAGLPSALKHTEISARIINEEGRRSSGSSSLNAARAAPIKGTKGKARDHSNLTCHYCQKKGHIQPDCRKKKKDEKDKEKKDKGSASGSGTKAVNSHVVETTASIQEVNDDMSVALYAASRSCWMMDSGATHHISPHHSDFKDFTPSKGTVRIGDSSTISQEGVGTVVFKSPQGYSLTLSNVLYVPAVKTRFMSTRALAQKGAEITFSERAFQIAVNRQCVAKGYLDNNLYWLDAADLSLNTHIGNSPKSLQIWHQRMGHMSFDTLKRRGPSALKGMDLDSSTMTVPTLCHGCEAGKSTRKPFPGSAKTTRRILEVVHSDLAGPMQVKSLQGSLYTATFIDDYSRHAVVYCLRSKDQFVVALQKFLSWAETQTSDKLRTLHSDRGGWIGPTKWESRALQQNHFR